MANLNYEYEQAERIRLAKEKLAKEKLEREAKELAIKTEKENKKCGKFIKGAGIISTIFFSCYMLLTIIAVFSGGAIILPSEIVMYEVLNFLLGGIIAETGVIHIIAVIFTLAYMITCFVFAIQLISIANSSLRVIKEKKATLITYTSFFFAWLVVPISLLISTSEALPIALLSLIIIGMCVAFLILDTISASNEKVAEIVIPTVLQEPIKTTKQQPKEKVEENVSNADKLTAELTKIKKLKDDGLIDDAEYKLLRENIMKNI